MKEINNETRDRYFAEAAIRLREAGFVPQPQEDKLLPVDWQGSRLCRLTAGGGAQFRAEYLDREGGRAAFDRVTEIAATTAEYMRLMEAAPHLVATGLSGDYRLLADFGGAVLAGHPTTHGTEFITWEWDYPHAGMWQGHYYGGNYAGAKQDFCIRAGLIKQNQLFSPEQLTEVYRAIHETLDSAYPITVERVKLLESAAEQIEHTVSDLEQRVDQSNQRELELGLEQNETGQAMY